MNGDLQRLVAKMVKRYYVGLDHNRRAALFECTNYSKHAEQHVYMEADYDALKAELADLRETARKYMEASCGCDGTLHVHSK